MIRLHSLARRALFAVLVALLPAAAEACTLCSCTTSVSSLSFGNYDPVSATPRDSTALVSVDCTGLVSLFGLIDIRASAGSSGNQLQRQMRRNGSGLDYNIYADAARTQILGDGQQGTTTVTASLNGLLFFSTSAPLYGRVAQNQWVPSGTYSDTIVITVQY
jgi:spore coat protein U-like protein